MRKAPLMFGALALAGLLLPAHALLGQLSASPASPTPVARGQQSLSDLARARRTEGVRPTPIVVELATRAPAPTPMPSRSLEESNERPALSVPTTYGASFRATAAATTPAPEPTPTTIAVERGLADAIADSGSKAGAAVGLAGLGFGVFALIVVALVWICSPFIGLRIGRSKGYPDWAGALAGLFLGPFVLFMALISKSSKKCPFCQSNIPIPAIVCPRCQREQPK